VPRLRVLLTGAAGRIGRCLLPAFQAAYELRTFDQRPVPGDPNAVVAKLEDLDALRRAAQGCEVVVHLAANPGPEEPFDRLLGPNIIGTHHVFQAACEAHARRIVYASSVHAVYAYPWEQKVEVEDPVRPAKLYGVAKIFGETLGRYYYEAHRMEFVGLRLGSFQEKAWKPPGRELLALWLGPEDAGRAFRSAVEKPGLTYALAFVTSRTAHEHLSLRAARELLDYEPRQEVHQFFGVTPPTPR
jgi:uronate dehydrogenase